MRIQFCTDLAVDLAFDDDLGDSGMHGPDHIIRQPTDFLRAAVQAVRKQKCAGSPENAGSA